MSVPGFDASEFDLSLPNKPEVESDPISEFLAEAEKKAEARRQASRALVSVPKKPIKVPKGIGFETFWNVVAAVQTAWELDKSQPDIKRLSEIAGYREQTVARVVACEEFEDAISRRGYQWNVVAGLTATQTYALSIMTDPSDRSDFSRKLRKAGVTHAMWRAWTKQPMFAKVLNKMSENTLSDGTHLALTQLTRRVAEGDLNAIKFHMEVTGRHNPAQQEAANIALFMNQVVEILTRVLGGHPELLQEIATEMQLRQVGQPKQTIREIGFE